MNRRPLVAVVVYEGVVTLDAVGPYEVFGLAQRPSGEPAYDVVLVAPEPGPIATASGLVLTAERSIREVDAHTLVIPGSAMGPNAACLREPVVAAVNAVVPSVTRVVGICTGAFVLAAIGLLDGRKATTHWSRADELARHHPDIDVHLDAIFVQDGSVWTSAGVTAGIDLALALVEADFGRAVALAIARELVVFLRRPGGQSQFSRYLTAPERMDDRLVRLKVWIADHLHEPLTVDRMARYLAMSPRNFRRLFRRELDTTPARFVEHCRIDAVAGALESSDDTLDALAGRFGLGNAERLRRAFHRWFGVRPSEYRSRFR